MYAACRFDKARSQLEVILPVVPPTAPPPALLQKMEPHEQEEEQQVPLVAGSSDDTSRQRDGTGSWAASSNECGVPQQLQAVPEVQVLNSNSPATASGQSARDTDSNVSSSGRSEQQLSENERKWLELHSTQLASGAKWAAQHATASEGAVLAGSAAPDLTGPGTIPGQAPQAQAEAKAEGSLTPPLPAVVLRPRLMASAALAEELD